jgi:hypothetical protein
MSIKSLKELEETLQQLGLEYDVHDAATQMTDYWGRQGKKAEVIIPKSRNKQRMMSDIGFKKNSEGEYDIIVDSDNRNLKNSIAQTHAALKVMRVAKAGKAVANVTEGEIPENLQQGGQNAIMVEVRI